MKLLSDYKHLLLIGLLNFLLIYISSFIRGYGYFIDEFYYIACANRPAFGFVDHPPLAPFILTIFQFIFGNSLFAIRFLPALASAFMVFYTGIITKEIGGGKYAQALAAITAASVPSIIAMAGFYSMNAFEPLLAIIAILITVRMIKDNNTIRWIPLGIVLGLGIMNKHTFTVIIFVLVISLLLAGKWKLILNRWFILGGLIAFIIFVPNILWQISNNYPSLEFYKNISARKNVYTPPVKFIIGQFISMSPFTAPLWLAGISFFMISRKMKEFRFIGIFFLVSFILMMVTSTSRSDRLNYAYPVIFTGGAIFFEDLFARYNLKYFKAVFILFIIFGIWIALPVILPYYSYNYVAAYSKILGMNTELERGNKPPLPQLLADRIGWEEKVDLVGKAYLSLTDSEKKRTIIAGDNYGQAGAIELFGKKYGIPYAVSGHNNYYLWSKGHVQGNILIQLSGKGSLKDLTASFDSVDVSKNEFYSPYVTSHENHLRVFTCRGPKMPTEKMLDRGKLYY
jgi:hypothetical protein